tara:strand:+ start:3214 stop:3669 length:456 start_codon:yes stop_codon:yes gene_type:complete
MGKGGANAYPGWWATSDEPVIRGQPTDWNKPDMKPYKKFYEEEERRKRKLDEFYNQKSYNQRRKEFEQEFKRKFMGGDFFTEDYETCNNHFHNCNSDEIHPIFKIKKSSSEEDFKKEYKKLILKAHPDKGGDSSFFIKIQEAWEEIKRRFI